MALTRRHALYDVWVGADQIALLEYVGNWPAFLCQVAARSGAVVLEQRFHQFDPVGVTGFVLLAESHLSMHTWPEEKLVAFDIFTCGNMDLDLVVRELQTLLAPVKEKWAVIERGQSPS